ncbi:MAG: YdcF family protein [Gallionella sp.]|nr:YdcF family protein [Gallionella sp.]MDD4946944.1 YdcF family protein [Gallionella sp.]
MNLVAVIRILLLPPLSLILLAVLGWLLRKHRAGRLLCAGSLLLLLLLSTQFGAWLLAHPLETMTRPLAAADRREAQAIVVLAAGRMKHSPEYDNQDIPDSVALARLRYAAKLQHETGLSVLVSGGMADAEEHLRPLSAGMADALEHDFATPVKWQEDRSANTAQNAEFSAAILKQAGIRRILLVTDAMHMPRAMLAFRQQDMDAIAAPTMFYTLTPLEPTCLVPGVEGLRRSNYALYEWLGLLWYRIRLGI